MTRGFLLHDEAAMAAAGPGRSGHEGIDAWIARVEWAVKASAWRVARAFKDYPCREEWISTALAAEVRHMLPGVSVTREAPCPIMYTPIGADGPVHCGTGRADLLIAVPGHSVVVEVKKDTPKTGAAQVP